MSYEDFGELCREAFEDKDHIFSLLTDLKTKLKVNFVVVTKVRIPLFNVFHKQIIFKVP